MGMILRIASSRIVGQGDIVGRSGYFSLNLSANSVMRGRLDARRTLKSLVADLRFKTSQFPLSNICPQSTLLRSKAREPTESETITLFPYIKASLTVHPQPSNLLTCNSTSVVERSLRASEGINFPQYEKRLSPNIISRSCFSCGPSPMISNDQLPSTF